MLELKEEIVLTLFEKVKEKNLNIQIKEENRVLVKNEELNGFLKTLFRFCSKNRICFNILREELDFLTIEIYA